LRSKLTSSGTLHLASLLDFDAALAFDSPRVAAAGFEESLLLITINSTGRFDPSSKELAVSTLRSASRASSRLKGQPGPEFSQGFYFKTEATAICEKLESLAALLEPRLPAQYPTRPGSGAGPSLLLSTRSSVQAKDNRQPRGSLALEGVELDTVLNGLPLQLRASGKIQAVGPLRALRLSADIRSSTGKLSLANLNVGRSDLHIVAATASHAVIISRLEAALKDLLIEVAAGKSLSFDKLTPTGTAGLNLAREAIVPNSMEAGFDAAIKNLFFAAAEGTGLAFDNVTLKGKIGLDAGKKIAALNSLEARFPGFAPSLPRDNTDREKLGRPRCGWKAAARISRRCARSWRRSSRKAWPAGAGGTGRPQRLMSAGQRPQRRIGDSRVPCRSHQASSTTLLSRSPAKGSTPFSSSKESMPASKMLSFRGALDISRGESLWKAVYVSWSRHPLNASVVGLYHLDSGAIDGIETRFFFRPSGKSTSSARSKHVRRCRLTCGQKPI